MRSLIASLLASTFWFTADQQGQRAFDAGEFREAAEQFDDPMWKGTALYRAGEFEQAQAVFAGVSNAESYYNRGNCLIFLGRYSEAAEMFGLALETRPDWPEAEDNRALALARAELFKQKGGDSGDQKIGADEIRFDKKKPGGQETQMNEKQAADPGSMQAIWLRRVQTEPADFLRAKFAYQEQFGKEESP